MDFYDLVNFCTYFSPIVVLVGVGVGIYYFKKLDILRKIVTFYLLAMFSVDILSRIIGRIYENNLFFIPIWGFLELFIFSLVYYFLGIKETSGKKISLIITIFSAFLFTLWEINKVCNAPIEEFQSYSKVISTLLIVLLSIGFFLENILKKKNISSDIFLLNSGILIYYSLTLIIFLPIDFLIQDNTGLKFYFWFANLIFMLVFYIFLILSIWKNGKTQE